MSQPTQDIFELVLARPVMTESWSSGEHPALVHLWWRTANQGDRLVQIYVDDQWFDVTATPTQHETWLLLDRTQPHRIELLAVSADDFDTAFPALLTSWNPRVTSAIDRQIVRHESLPLNTMAHVELNHASDALTPLWPGHVNRSGFGALFGDGGFGTDAATGPGLGRGQLGFGPLGTDGTALHYHRDHLAAGTHTLAFNAIDPLGRSVTSATTTETIDTDALPSPPAQLSFNSDFTIQWENPNA